MAKKSLPSVATDFAEVWEFFKTRGLIPTSPAADLVTEAKALHRCTYSLILWKFRLKKLPSHGKVFIEEIASDALQVLPQAVMGYGKTTALLTRGVIENLLRHLYFMDHPVEFDRMNREHKWYLGTEDLFDYPMLHPRLLGLEAQFDAINRLRNLYSDLSAGVHGRTVEHLEMRTAIGRITLEMATFRKQVVVIKRVAEAVNFLLASFHSDQVRGFQLEDRQIILRTMPLRARQVWHGIA